MASSHHNQGATEILDEALRLVDAVQRKLLTAAVRRHVHNVASPPPHSDDDVWAEAIRQETAPEPPLADQVLDIARETLPEIGRHLSAAGALMFDAMSRSLSAVERSLRSRPEDGPAGSPTDGER